MQKAWKTQPLASRALPHLRQAAKGCQGRGNLEMNCSPRTLPACAMEEGWEDGERLGSHTSPVLPRTSRWLARLLDELGYQDAKCTGRALQFNASSHLNHTMLGGDVGASACCKSHFPDEEVEDQGATWLKPPASISSEAPALQSQAPTVLLGAGKPGP